MGKICVLIFSTTLTDTQISRFVKIRLVGAKLFHADGRIDRDGQTNTTTLIVAFRSFANSSKSTEQSLPSRASIRLTGQDVNLPAEKYSKNYWAVSKQQQTLQPRTSRKVPKGGGARFETH